VRVDFEPVDPEYEARVRRSFERQRYMSTLGVRLAGTSPGCAILEMSADDALTQAPGVLHAGVCTALMNSASVLAATTLVGPKTSVLAVEFKVDLIEPSQGVRFRAVAEVVSQGRTLTRCRARLEALGGGRTRLVAQMATTLANVSGR
jgi:uncharacterized protein (TIGR00369 family)